MYFLFSCLSRNFHAKFMIDPSGKLNNEASELVSALFTAGRNATLSMEAAANALVKDQSKSQREGQPVQQGMEQEVGNGDARDNWIEPTGSGVVLLDVVRKLCDRHLCPWFSLSEEDCGQLRMQILMDVY